MTNAPEIADPKYDEAPFYDDPFPEFARLRRADPVHWYEAGPCWIITRNEDIRFISSRPDLFSSKNVAILGDLERLRRGEPRRVADGISFLDPPEHHKHRKVISPEMTPAAVNRTDGAVREVVRDCLDPLGRREPFDAVEALAEPIPVNVFARLLGVPEHDWGKMLEWSTVIANAGGGGESPERMAAVYAEVRPYLESLIEPRRTVPRDDYLSIIAHATVDGEPLTNSRVISWAITLLAAGSETTQSLITGIIYALALHPEQAERVLADRALAPAAVEEALRWWTPVWNMARQATADVQLGDTMVRAGDAVLLCYGSGNRDEAVWGADAADFRIDRPGLRRHLAFGFGEHFCIGAHLARREVIVMIEEMADRFSSVELAAEPIRRRSNLIHTFDELPIILG